MQSILSYFEKIALKNWPQAPRKRPLTLTTLEVAQLLFLRITYVCYIVLRVLQGFFDMQC